MLTQQLFNGVLLGTTFALIALGFNLVVGALDRLNFALGETAMVSAMIGAVLMETGPCRSRWRSWWRSPWAAASRWSSTSCRSATSPTDYPTASILSQPRHGPGAHLRRDQAVRQRPALGARRARRASMSSSARPGRPAPSWSSSCVAALMTVRLYLFLDRTVWGTAIRGVSDDADVAALLGVPGAAGHPADLPLSGVLAGACGPAHRTGAPHRQPVRRASRPR